MKYSDSVVLLKCAWKNGYIGSRIHQVLDLTVFIGEEKTTVGWVVIACRHKRPIYLFSDFL